MIRIENLEKRYGNFTLNMTLSVQPGTVTGIIGKNGAGKSTTIKSILGLVKPDSGTVKVFGKEARMLTGADKEAIGVAFSDSGFSQYLYVEDVIRIMKKMYHAFDETFFRNMCKEQELPLNKEIKDFSTGMKAKLRVLCAISHQAKLLILDEPTSGLDVLARTDILDMLRSYMEEDGERAIIISSHISSDLETLCDDIYMIDKGQVILHEDTDVILGNYGILKVSDEDYEKLDKQYLIRHKKEKFGYTCLTKEKQFYLENYPDIVIENGDIDSMILMILGGK